MTSADAVMTIAMNTSADAVMSIITDTAMNTAADAGMTTDIIMTDYA